VVGLALAVAGGVEVASLWVELLMILGGVAVFLLSLPGIVDGWREARTLEDHEQRLQDREQPQWLIAQREQEVILSAKLGEDTRRQRR
jgi:hypothetical protein